MTRASALLHRLFRDHIRLFVGCAAGVVALLSVLPRIAGPTVAQTEIQLPPIPSVEFGITNRELLERVYHFAARNRDVVDHVPCFCGCERLHDHTAVASCFVSSPSDVLPVAWNDHGARCVICTNVVKEAMEQWENGRSIAELRSSIIAKYRTEGMPMTPTPQPSDELGQRRKIQRPPQ